MRYCPICNKPISENKAACFEHLRAAGALDLEYKEAVEKVALLVESKKPPEVHVQETIENVEIMAGIDLESEVNAQETVDPEIALQASEDAKTPAVPVKTRKPRVKKIKEA